MRVGYARVSDPDQSIEAQVERLCDCEKIFQDKLSGSRRDRPELASCLEFVRDGDVLVTTRLDRLARSVFHLCDIAAVLREKGVALQVIDQQIDTTTSTGRLLFHMLAAIAEFELSIRKEAQQAGIQHARASSRYKGGVPKLLTQERDSLVSLSEQGWLPSQLARKYRISTRTVYRYLRDRDVATS